MQKEVVHSQGTLHNVGISPASVGSPERSCVMPGGLFTMAEDKIIWQSAHFPKLQMSQRHLDLLRAAYPDINRFEPLLREMELWLHDKPERAPKKNWKRFISNWVRNSRKYRKQETVNYGDSARREDNDPKALDEIMNKLIERTRA